MRAFGSSKAPRCIVYDENDRGIMVLDSIDVVVIGAGAAGITAARQAAECGKRVLVIEKRSHIGGHCYDRLDENGIYIHQYGPHIFHTKIAGYGIFSPVLPSGIITSIGYWG